MIKPLGGFKLSQGIKVKAKGNKCTLFLFWSFYFDEAMIQ